MARPKKPTFLKYRIKSKIAEYDSRTAAAIRKAICGDCNISAQTLTDWENIRENDKREIPSGQLLRISKLMGTRMELMFTQREAA